VSFTLYSSNRMELLVEYLSQVLKHQPLPPLTAETVVVQSQGMARWLAMELARRCGVWANGSFPFPNTLLAEVFGQVLGEEPMLEAWQRPVLTWRIMALFDELRQQESFRLVDAYAATPLKGYQLAAAVADLFDQYMIYRPELIRHWQRGGEEDFWQAVLWRRLSADIDAPNRADLFRRCLARLADEQCPLGSLPPRLSIFGISSLPPLYLDLFQALARHLEINIFFLNPCAQEWSDILPQKTISRLERAGATDRQDLYLSEANPLLASMGRLGRDFCSLLLECQLHEEALYLEPEEETLLAAIQADILNGRDAAVGHDVDDSLCFASCHSAIREVEVLHDHLLGLCSVSGQLEPRHILVMAPDIGTYAPLVEAVFGSDERQLLPYTIADQSHGREECIVAFFQVLDLAASRFKALDVMALLESAALRRRFGLSLDDVALISAWLAELRVCWGRDAEHRRAFGLPPHGQNTWQAGLDRLLLGFAMGDDQLFGSILPHYGAHLEPELAGRFLSFYRAVADWAQRLQGRYALAGWRDLLLEMVADLFAPDQDEERDLLLLRTALAALEQEAVQADFTRQLGLDVVQARLTKAVRQDVSPYGFMGGGITFSSLLPMRAVPFKVVCLLGMNDGAFPRSPARYSFDRMAASFQRGDRSMRFDDRYLFLEALLSARRQLYISFQGRSALDDSPRAASVLVRELLEYAARMTSPVGATDEEVQERLAALVAQHHLQPFHPAYFRGELPSFSQTSFKAAQALVTGDNLRVDFQADLPLPAAEEERRSLHLRALQRFWQAPAQFFCEQRLGLRLADEEDLPLEDEPFTVKGLDRYSIYRDLIHGLLAAEPLELAHLQARGVLPHGAMARVVYDEMQGRAAAFAKRVALLGGAERRTASGLVRLGEYEVEVEFADINETGQFHFRFGKMDGRHLLRAWLSHLAINSLAQRPDMGCTSLLIADDAVVRFSPLSDAAEHLHKLLDLYWQGLRYPLPFFARASHVYVAARGRGKTEEKALQAAAATLWGSDFNAGEWCQNPYLQRCFPEGMALGPDFCELAGAVYGPLLAIREEV